MRKAAILFILLTVGAAFGAWFVSNQIQGDTPLADLAPQETVLYVEAPDLKGALEQIRGSEAATDFERSRVREELTKVWGQLNEQADKGEGPLAKVKKLGLALNETTALRFGGQGAVIGLTAPTDGPPALYAMSRVDIAGLAEDLAASGKSWLEVWQALRAKVSPDGKVEDYKGYQIASRELERVKKTVYFTQAKDVVFTSTQRWAVAAFLDAHLGTRPGLSSHPGYNALGELESEDLIVRGWVDFGFLRDGNKVKQLLVALAKEEDEKAAAELEKVLKGSEMKVLAASTKELPGLAGGVYFEKGSPYAVRVGASHAAEAVFSDNSTVSPDALAGANPGLYVELPRLGRVLGSMLGSKGWQTLRSTEAYAWIEKNLEDPAKLAAQAGDPGLQEALTHDPRFELRMALAAADLVLPELLGDRYVASATPREEATQGDLPLEVVVSNRVRPVTRILALIAEGAVQAHAREEMVKTETIGGRTVYVVGEPGSPDHFCVTLAGADLVATRGKGHMTEVLTHTASESATTLGQMRKALEGEPGALVYYDASRLVGAMQHMQEMQAQQSLQSQGRFYRMQIEEYRRQEAEADKSMKDFYREQIKQMEEALAELEAGAEVEPLPKELEAQLQTQSLVALHMNADFTQCRIQSVQRYGEQNQSYLSALYPAGQSVEDAHLARLPRETFAGLVMRHDVAKAYEGLKASFGAKLFEELEEGLQREVLGEERSLAKDILEPMGDWSGFAVLTQPALPAKDAPKGMPQVAVPAFVGLLAYEGEAFEKTVLGLLEEVLQKSMRSGEGEGQITGQLKSIATAQSLFREGDKDGDGKLQYADSLDALKDQGLVWFPDNSPYTITVRASGSTPEFMWMAMASPKAGPGKHYAITHQGVIYHAWKPFAYNDACEVPEGAVHLGAELGPPPADFKAPKAEPILVKAEVEGHAIYRVTLPKDAQREFGPAGRGFSPCLAFHEGALVVATSEHALLASLTKREGGLVKAPTFGRLTAPLSKRGSALSYFAVAGLIDQVNANAELIAENMAPLPSDMKAPEFPEYREPPEGADMQKFYEEQQKEQQAWQEKYEAHREASKTWRKEHAAENAASMRRILGSLKVLGGMVGSAWAEGEDLRSDGFMLLDPEGKPAVAEGK